VGGPIDWFVLLIIDPLDDVSLLAKVQRWEK